MTTPTTPLHREVLNPYYRVAEVATRYHVHETTVRKWIRSGLLAAIAIGNGPKAHLRIPREALEEFDSRQVKVETEDAE